LISNCFLVIEQGMWTFI